MQQFKIGGETKRSKFAPLVVELDFEKLPEASRAFIVAYGIRQYLADGAAGAKDQTAFNDGVNERARKLREADFTRTRGEAGPTDSPEVLGKKLARDDLRETLKVKNVKVSKEQFAAAAEALFKRDEAKYLKAAEKEIAARKARAEEITKAEGDDILAQLGLTGGDEEPQA